MKLKFNKKQSILVRLSKWVSRVNRYLITYRLLKADPAYDWSFRKYYLQTRVFNNYEIRRMNDGAEFLVLVVIKKITAESGILFEKIITPNKSNLRHHIVLQALKHILITYAALDFRTAIFVVDYTEVRLIKMLEQELDFERDEASNLAYLLTSHKEDKITFSKQLTIK